MIQPPGDKLSKRVEKVPIEMEANNHSGGTEQSPIKFRGLESESLNELKESIENDFQTVQVNRYDIVKAASRAKKSTGGGLCQLTPWHLKTAVDNSSGNKCAKVLAQWANRWARGEFDTSLGAVMAIPPLVNI